MTLTLNDAVTIAVFAVIGLIPAVCAFACSEYSGVRRLKWPGVILGITAVICIGIAIFSSWLNTNTASGVRAVKDWQSERENGIEREITITAEDGREIFRYKGKIDVESDHEDNYLKFESEDGRRYLIYYGVQDTITIIETGD